MSSLTARRRIVTGHVGGMSTVLADDPISTYAFDAIPGFEHAYVWRAGDTTERKPREVDEAAHSALPPPGGSIIQFVTFPTDAQRATATAAPEAQGLEWATRLPDLADTFEEQSHMHRTTTLDYGLIVSGELWLDLDDGKTVHLYPGDVVVQQGTRHGWSNRGSEPATIVFFMVGAPGQA